MSVKSKLRRAWRRVVLGPECEHCRRHHCGGGVWKVGNYTPGVEPPRTPAEEANLDLVFDAERLAEGLRRVKGMTNEELAQGLTGEARAAALRLRRG